MVLTDSEPYGRNLNSHITQGTSEYSPISEGLEDDAKNDNLGEGIGDDGLKDPELAVVDVTTNANQNPFQME